MIKVILRSIGIGCILAGAILYFTNADDEPSSIQKYKDEATELKMELERVKEELAVAQTLSSPKEPKVESPKPETSLEEIEEIDDQEKSSETIIKTVLTIESGSTSTSVAAKLERSGIIDNGTALEQYLSDNKLSGRIQIGEHEVDSTMDIQEIASIITNTKR